MTTLRARAFWLRDRLTGNSIRKELRQIQAINRDPTGNRQREALAAQLEYVAKTIPYYRELENHADLTSFPVVNKQIIRDNAEQFMRPGLDIETAHRVYTSGSTGIPFQAYWDAHKRDRATAEAIFFAREAGYELGTPFFYLETWTRGLPSRIERFARNWIAESPIKWDYADVKAITEKMNRYRGPVSVLANSSTFDLMAQAMREDPAIRSDRVGCIIGQSEGIVAGTGGMLAERYGVQPICRYGMEEVGMIAQQSRGDGESPYWPNHASFFIEILREDTDEAAPVGELGRIVITELVNRAQPFIRYDTGDLGAFLEPGETPPAHAQQALARIQGRKNDRLYDVNDRPLSPLIGFTNFSLKYRGLRQYQIVQRGRGDYLLRLNVDGDFVSEDAVVGDFKADVGAGAHVVVQYDTEDFVWNSGKRKVVLSEYEPVTADAAVESPR